MDSKQRHPVNLKQYRKVSGKWQFAPVARDAKGNPDPRLVLLNGEPVSSKGGTFYLDFSENGKRKQQPIGTIPREALEAWRTKLAVLSGQIEPDPETEVAAEAGLTVDRAIENYLVEVEATKGEKTYRQYRRELEWFRTHCKKRVVSQLNRSDAMALFAQGRRELLDGKPLNQKTINRRVIIMLHAMRSQGAVITMNKGDWPKTIDKKVEIYQPEELKPFFAVCNPEERLIFQVFLCSGFREREVATLAWTDIQWKDGKLAVSAKPELGLGPQTVEHCGRCAWGSRGKLRPRAQARRPLSRTEPRQAPTKCCVRSTAANAEPEAGCAWRCYRWCIAPDSKRRGLPPVARTVTSPTRGHGPSRSHPAKMPQPLRGQARPISIERG
jgi:hypothetical protein